MTIDPHAYNISVRRGVFDGETLFEARVKELPDLVEYAGTHVDAYELAVDAIETAAAAYADQGRAFPDAQVPAEDFSGRVTLRVPRSLHRALAEAAEQEGVSLNQHLVNVLTYFSGFAAGAQSSESAPWQSVPRPAQSARARTHLRLIRCESLDGKAGACG